MLTLGGVLGVLAVVLAFTMGGAWLGLFVYLSVAGGHPALRAAYWAIPASAVVMYLIGLRSNEAEARGLFLLVLLIGFAMTGVGQLVRTTIELRKPGPPSPSSPPTRSACGSPATCTTC